MFDKSQPLWLPPGSVRAIVALIVVLTTVINLMMNKESNMLNQLSMLVLGFYFGSKTKTNEVKK